MDEPATPSSESATRTEQDHSVTHDEREAGAVAPYVESRSDRDWEAAPPEAEAERGWRQELPRWLATLDAPSTRREYEKAVRYFFETTGLPQGLGELTYDLLIAYRGSLARRAERGATQPGPRGPGDAPAIAAAAMGADALPGPDATHGQAADEPPLGRAAHGAASRTGPLAPATANLRITALRRFLLHCVLWDLLPHLSSDRIAAALRRLRIERRRPYQVLAEPEWEAFLAAARLPERPSLAPAEDSAARDHLENTDSEQSRGLSKQGPWGIPRAVRRRLASETATPASPPSPRGAAPVRSRAGLTGAHTARRDHALLALALATGLRAIELCALDVGDLHREWHGGREEWWLILPDEKTKGQRGGRTLPLGPDLARTLTDYLASTSRHWERSQDRASPLFLSYRRRSPHDDDPSRAASAQRLSTAQVRRIVDRVEAQWAASANGAPDARGAGRAISPHALRHSTAVALLEGNETTGRPPASVEHVRGWLGHFDIRTTQGYLAHVDSRRHRRPFALDPVRADAAADEDESGE